MNSVQAESCTPLQKSSLLFSNKQLWLLIWPLLVEQLLQITLGIADVFMISSRGEVSVSGVNLVDQINVLLTQLFAALGTGGAVVCSQYIGGKRRDMAEKTSCQLIYTTLIFSVFLLLIGVFFYKPILSFTFGDVEDSVMEASRKYFYITLFALPGIALYNACASLFRAQGNSRISMEIAFLVNVINIGGNAILIYGMGWGVEGVAYPTMISRTIAAVILFILLYSGKKNTDGSDVISIKGIHKIHFDWTIISRILKIGVPNGIEGSAFQIGKILVLSLTASYGTAAIAANSAANTLASLGVFPAASVGLGMLTVVGQCMGAGKPEQASYYTKKMMAIAYVGMWILDIPFLIFCRNVVGLYKLPELTTDIAFWMAFIHTAFGLFIWPVSFTLPNSLRAANDASFTMIVSMVSMWTVRIGLAYVFKYTDNFGVVEALNLHPAYGSIGVWIAMMIDWVVRSSFFCVRFARGKWKNRQLI